MWSSTFLGAVAPFPGARHTQVWDAQRGMLNPLPPAATAGWLPAPVPEHLDHYHSTSWHQAGASPSATLPPAPSSCSPLLSHHPVGTDRPGGRAGGHHAATSVLHTPESPWSQLPDARCQVLTGEAGGLWGKSWNFRDLSESIPSHTSPLLLQPCFSRGWDEHGHRGLGGKSRAEQSSLGSSSSNSEGVMGS